MVTNIKIFSDPEPQIIDFITQQYKLFPNIATCFAFQYAANWLWDVYNNVTSELESGQMDNLPEVYCFVYIYKMYLALNMFFVCF